MYSNSPKADERAPRPSIAPAPRQLQNEMEKLKIYEQELDGIIDGQNLSEVPRQAATKRKSI